MSFYKQFSTDSNLESKAGVVLDYGAAGKITIHRAGGSNKKFGEVLTAKLKPYRRQIDAGVMADDVANRVLAEAYAESVIIGWEGVTDAEGNDLEFNRRNVVQLLTDLPELFKDIQGQANSVSNFRAEQIAADAETVKNA
jgi:hypothetical protein